MPLHSSGYSKRLPVTIAVDHPDMEVTNILNKLHDTETMLD